VRWYIEDWSAGSPQPLVAAGQPGSDYQLEMLQLAVIATCNLYTLASCNSKKIQKPVNKIS
jgi:hypothetical protein